MATFTFGKGVDIHWNGYEIVGPALTVFSIPDQLYEEFEGDFREIEPSLTWIDTNEFLTLQNAVSVTTLEGTFPILVTPTSSGKIVSVSSSAANDGYVLTANGSGGVAWESLPADATGITNIIGTSPISAAVSGTQATISINQSLLTAGAATTSEGIRTYVKNTTGSTILKGSAVYIIGATGDNALIGLASATTEATSSKVLGLVYQDIPTDSFGYVVEAGYFTGINTSTTSAGSAVWLGNAPGSLVFVSPPAEPSNSVYLGVVVRSQLNNGTILVKVQNGYEIDELHDVSAGSPTDLDILQYKNSSGMWTKASIANAGIAASVHTHNYVTSVIGTSPVSVLTSSGTSTVSIIASSIDSTHLANGAVTAGKISSGAATSGTVLTADGTGGAAFTAISSDEYLAYIFFNS